MNRAFKVTIKLANSNVPTIRRCTTTSSVPGLSKNVLNVSTEPAGFPGACKEGLYKNPEYFSYHNTSYFEAEIEMMKYRLPQPVAKKEKKRAPC